MMDISWSR